MYFEEDIKFPCGLSISLKFNKGRFDFWNIEWNLADYICPIHGKDCKK